jgi:hypothetical protein
MNFSAVYIKYAAILILKHTDPCKDKGGDSGPTTIVSTFFYIKTPSLIKVLYCNDICVGF